MKRFLSLILSGVLALALVGCGDDDSSDEGGASDDPAASDDGATDDADDGSDSDSDSDGDADEDAGEQNGSGGGGTLTFDGEEIALDSARCTFEEQEAAAGGGTIEFVAQGNGTNAAGEEVFIDVSRYSEESQFAGDDVSIVIGDIATGASFRGSEDAGTVSEDGSTVEATDFPVKSDEDFSDERTISFSIDCG